jgi:hypothetical protein
MWLNSGKEVISDQESLWAVLLKVKEIGAVVSGEFARVQTHYENQN